MRLWVAALACGCAPAFDEDGCPNEDHPGVTIYDDPAINFDCQGDRVSIGLHFPAYCPTGCIEERLLKKAP
jgi:hypothetical protein